MHTKPFITIITPTYNREALLPKAIASIVEQEGQNEYDWEHIIVDDGSVDNTKYIVEQRQKKYPNNIFYYYQKNSGIPGVARNLGIEKMNNKSNYVLFLDSDDTYEADCIQKCLSMMTEDENIAGCYFLCKDEDGKIRYPLVLKDKSQTRQTLEYKDYISGQMDTELGIIIQSKYFQKEGMRFDDEVISESVLRSKRRKLCHTQKKQIKLINYVGRIYIRNHKSQLPITMDTSKERFKKNALGYEKILDNIREDIDQKRYAMLLAKSSFNRRLYGDEQKAKQKAYQAYKKHSNIKYLLLRLIILTPNFLIKKLYKHIMP